MNPNNGYHNQRAVGQPPKHRRILPARGTFTDAAPIPNGAQAQRTNRLQYPPQPAQNQQILPSHQAFAPPQLQHVPQIPLAPLIPLSAVEDLQPPVPFTNGAFQDPLNRAYATNGPAVYEGFIPAPGREDEDDFANPSATAYRNGHDESSDEDAAIKRIRAEYEYEEELRQIEEKDDSEVDQDYSEEDAQIDEGDPDEMELGEDFEDWEERVVRKKSKSNTKGLPSTRGVRGGRCGRASSRGRGGQHAPVSTRKRRPGKPGRPKGIRGPRAVADPGEEFKEWQRQANERFIAEDYSAALEFAQKAIQVNPEIFDTHNIISECYAAMGQEESSIEALIVGAPTKRDVGLWQFIIERINKLDTERYPKYTEEIKAAANLVCLNEIIKLDNNYEARSHKLEIEAGLGRSSKCVLLGVKMLKTCREENKDPDTAVLKTMAMMGTTNAAQTKKHLERLIESFHDAIAVFTKPDRDPSTSELDWELINIYADLLERTGKYDSAIFRLKTLSRWKDGRRHETYWDEQEDDREFDIEDEPRRVRVFEFVRGTEDAKHGQVIPMEIRVKLGLFRLRRSPNDFTEAMHHLEMLEPDDHSPGALVWDYEDLFRIVADALHATGHDKDALRFYGPLYGKNSRELNLMSYIGLHTCYKSQEQHDKASEIIPILKKWSADTYDELAILAKFFEDQGMWQEAAQRAETIYRDRYGQKLKRLGFQAYDELRAYHYQQRREARGKYSVKKSTIKRNRKIMQKATAQDQEDDNSENEGGTKELPTLAQVVERPKKGLFRTKKAKSLKTQLFLPVQTDFETPEEIIPQPSLLEGTDVPLGSIDRFFRRKLENLANEFAEDLTAARAQHREIVCSFERLDEIVEAAEEGDEEATNTFISITRELIEEFSTFDLFYFNRKEDITTYFRRIGNGNIWKDSALMVLAVIANNVEDGETDPELKERPDTPPQEFWGIHFDAWCDAFGRYAVLLARSGDDTQCFATLDIALQSNIFYRSRTYHQQLQFCRIACALAVDNSLQASSAARWLLKEYPFGTDPIRLYSAVNRLCSFPDGYATGPAHKVLMRYIKTMDYALLSPAHRRWYNFRDGGKFSKGGFTNHINSENVDRVADHDPALFALYAHVLMCGGSYMAALNYFFRAFAITPEDPVLNLSIGAAYIQHAMKRLSENRQYQIQQGLAFVHRYVELRTKDGVAIHEQEAEFNVGRIWHGLGLVALALPAYERCVALRERVGREARERGEEVGGYEDFAVEAAFAMQNIYVVAGNAEMAMRVTEEVLVLE